MGNGIPADEASEQVPGCAAETGTAVGVGSMSDHGSGPESEIDEDDDDSSPVPGRSFDQDVRIAIHEAGHVVAARLLGRPVGGVTVTPDPARGYEGLCWGIAHTEAFAEGRGDASNLREALAPVMPKAGEDRRPVADVFGNVYAQCIELMAGRAAEAMLLDGEPAAQADDLRQARELALLICSTEEAIETFIEHSDVAARDLLLPHGDAVIVISTVLRIKRTLDGAEIDKIISDLQAGKTLAVERARRKLWQRVVESAAGFTPE
jgi:hypothetical protein